MGVYYEQVEITGDASGLERALDSASRKVSSSATDWARRLTTAGRSLSRFGQSATRYVTLPLIGAAAAAVKFASDAEETANKVRVTFGRMARSIFDWSKNSIRNMGFAQQTAQEMASTFGLLFHAAKLPQPEIVRLSKQFTQLAGDMVSFFNVPIDQALMDLRSGLVGETEPLRKYGVLLSEAALQQEAVRMGLIRADQELTEQQKVMARASVITNSLSKAQGDFVRTSDSVANAARSTVEQLKEMAAGFGKDLLPVAKEALGVVQDLIEDFRSLSPEMRQNIIKWGALAIVLGPVVRLLGGALTITGSLLKTLPALARFVGLASSAATAGAGAGAAGGAAGAAGGLAAAPLAKLLAAGGGMVAPLAALGIGFVALNERNKRMAENFEHTVDGLADMKLATWKLTGAVEDAIPELDAMGGEATELAQDLRQKLWAAFMLAGNQLRLTGDNLADFTAAMLASRAASPKLRMQLGLLFRELEANQGTLSDTEQSILMNKIAAEDWKGALKFLRGVIDNVNDAQERYASRQSYAIVQDRLRTKSVAKFGEEVRARTRDVKGLGDAIGSVPDLNIDLVIDIIRNRLRTEGAVKGGALGGIVHAAAGGIAQMPIYQFGEGAYHTPFGRGAEGIIPFDSRGIRVLSEALGMAMSKMGGSSAPMDYDRLARALSDALGRLDLTVRIGDFEVARALDRRRTRLGQR